MLPAKILKWLMQSILIGLSPKRSIIIYYNNIDYSYTPGYSLAIGDAPREMKKKTTCSSWCVFIIFGTKITLVTYWGPHGNIFGPTPQGFRKEMNNILYLLNFYVHFQRVFVEFVALLTKIWLKILTLMLERGLFPPSPISLHTTKWSMQFKSFFFITTYNY